MIFFASKKLIGSVAASMAVMMLVLAVLFSSVDRDTLAATIPVVETPSGQVASVEEAERETEIVTEDALWLARVIYSETKRPYEQELVAWVVRNRVETAFRGKNTYKGVVLDPWQFSAFNRNAPKRAHYSNLTPTSTAAGWQTALSIAQKVVDAPAQERPFAQSTRHFYSEVSMVGRRAPAWANGKRPVSVDRQVDPRRFRFFSNIS